MQSRCEVGARRVKCRWMSAATTTGSRLPVFVPKKFVVRGPNHGLPICLEKKTYGRPGVAIPDGVVPAENGLPEAPLIGVKAPVPAVMV